MAVQITDREVQLALPAPTKLFTPGVVVLLVLLVLGYAIFNHAESFVRAHLLLHSGDVLHGRLWQLVTYAFINGGCSLGFSIVLLLFLGSALEREWRTGSFLLLWLVATLVCGAIWTVVNLVLGPLAGREYIGMGNGPGDYAIIAAFGLVFRHRRFLLFFWTVEAQTLALIFIGISLILAIAAPIYWIWVAGAGVAYVYIKGVWRLKRAGSVIPRAGGKKRPGSFVEID